MPERDLTVFVGAFGSGKTETAINYAVRRAEENRNRVALVDLDIVNPYFRSREEEVMLARRGIRVISTADETRQADIPALSAAIYSVFQDRALDTVFDVGGDPNGARVLGRFNQQFCEEPEYHMHLVVNPYRPMTSTPDEIVAMAGAIEYRSRLKITSLVCNPHLRAETDWGVVNRGYRPVRRAAEILGLPIAFVCVPAWISPGAKQFDEPLFPLELHMLPPWEKGEA